jgi:hypothetical protein
VYKFSDISDVRSVAEGLAQHMITENTPDIEQSYPAMNISYAGHVRILQSTKFANRTPSLIMATFQ